MRRARLRALLAIATLAGAALSGPPAKTQAPIRVRPLPPSPEPAGARISLKAPRRPIPQEAVASVRLKVRGFRLGAPTRGTPPAGFVNDPRGQFVALQVDQEPYVAHYDVSKPVSLGKLTLGTHAVRAVLMRSWGEALKGKSALARAEVAVGTRRFHVLSRGPLLTLLQPGKQVIGERLAVLDFRLDRIRKSHGVNLRLRVDAQEFHLTQVVPHAIEGLDAGSHEVTLATLNRFEAPLLNRFARAARLFELRPPP